ncbi:MAG: hypothetical protein NT051_03580 [Candidatus Micrarchaeota archaeon]|nr:hypothetical protein [Candidatus Micrarchaeota archaeon]
MAKPLFNIRGQGATQFSCWKTYCPLSRGQGATEYLVLLAVVLIIALVAIALLGFFPGLADDSRLNQNRVMWKSKSPIAIIDAVAGDEGLWVREDPGADAIKMTLQNVGGEPVQILALYTARQGPENNQPHPYSLSNPNTVFGEMELQHMPFNYQFLISYAGDPEYALYIAPPHGNGTKYTPNGYAGDFILQPGESATIGYTIPDISSKPGTSYPSRTCGGYLLNNYGISDGSGQKGRIYEMTNFQIYYASIVEGEKTVKSEEGTLMAPCVPDLGDAP